MVWKKENACVFLGGFDVENMFECLLTLLQNHYKEFANIWLDLQLILVLITACDLL